jgi:hypothetical protein
MSDDNTIELVRHLRIIARYQNGDMEISANAADEITRLRAHNEKMLAHSVDLERMLSFGAANNDDLLAVVRAMREEDKP